MKLIVYGLGRDYEEHEKFIRDKYEILGVSDSDLSKEIKYNDFIRKENILNLDFDKILVCSEDYFKEIKKDLICLGIDDQKIIGLDGNVINLKGREPIIVVKLSGGMGNLMFQYAFYLKLKFNNINTPIKVDISFYYLEQVPEAFQIPWVFERIFNLKLPIATREEIAESKRQKKYYEKELSSYDKEVADIKAGYIVGYWQTAKYFKGIEGQVRKTFRFDLMYLSNRQKTILEKINGSKNSVAVWIRRGDYVTSTEINSLYGNICTKEYYDTAMEYIRQKYKTENFFIFSNDSDYVQENYKKYPSMTYADNSTEFWDMSIYLMSQCDHIIISNSTFSWWAAWLHKKMGTIISPDKFINGHATPDIWE